VNGTPFFFFSSFFLPLSFSAPFENVPRSGTSYQDHRGAFWCGLFAINNCLFFPFFFSPLFVRSAAQRPEIKRQPSREIIHHRREGPFFFPFLPPTVAQVREDSVPPTPPPLHFPPLPLPHCFLFFPFAFLFPPLLVRPPLLISPSTAFLPDRSLPPRHLLPFFVPPRPSSPHLPPICSTLPLHIFLTFSPLPLPILLLAPSLTLLFFFFLKGVAQEELFFSLFLFPELQGERRSPLPFLLRRLQRKIVVWKLFFFP